MVVGLFVPKCKLYFLTPAEGRLLRIFIENIGKVFTHRELVLLVQGYSTTQQEAPEILRPLVSRLRQKLAEFPSLMQRVVSVRGTGYVFEDERNPSDDIRVPDSFGFVIRVGLLVYPM